jgi:transposase
MSKFGEKKFEVKILTRDMASNYDWFGRENFMNAAQVADKFHVLRHAFEALQDIRIYYRQSLLTQKREAFEIFKRAKKQNPKLIFEYPESKLSNKETRMQLLARSQYLLYKKSDQWSFSQQQRAKLLFKHYPDLKTAYELICDFRAWYAVDNVADQQASREAKLNALEK